MAWCTGVCLKTDAASVQWALGEGPERREGMVPISEGEPGSVMLVFDKGMARVVVAQSAEQAWEAPAVEVIDVEDIPLAYLGDALCVRVKAVGDLML